MHSSRLLITQRIRGRPAEYVVGGQWAAAMIYTLLCAHFITSTRKTLTIDHLNRYTEFIQANIKFLL